MRQAGFFDLRERQKKLLATRDFLARFSGSREPVCGMGIVPARAGQVPEAVNGRQRRTASI